MCGIAGVFDREPGARVDPTLLRSMCDRMVRRGPDDEGFWLAEQVGLGMRRLSIIDVAGGHQPIANEDETLWIVFNGEIFNHEELRRHTEAQGHRYRTRSDTETILHLYEDEGPGCLHRLRGMFAIAIWDNRARRLFVARDRLGVKPLHYYWDGRRFVFASEIKGVLADPRVPRQLDWTAIDAFFAYGYIPSPWTAYRGVAQLLPGHFIVVDDRGLRMEKYWDLQMEPKLRASEEDIRAEFLDRLRESVRMRLVSEVPLGAYLSGGVDSSLVVAMMAQASNRPPATFTIGFRDAGGNVMDERPYAREVSERYRTRHVEFEVRPDVTEALDVALDAFDQPFADDSIIPTHHICHMAREHVTVALTGLGGDENFAGYERHLGFALTRGLSRSPFVGMSRLLRPAVRRLREQRSGHYRVNHLKRFLEAVDAPPPQRWQRMQAVFTAEARRSLYTTEVARQVDFEAVDRAGHAYFERVEARDLLDRALYQDIKMYLPDDILALTDRVGMWHSLELRVPFVDHTLMEFCARIPSRLKIRGLQKKYLLKQAARPFLPLSVLTHRKQGFASPMAFWLRGELRAFVDAALSPERVQRTGVLDPAQVRSRLEAHQRRRALNDRQIFAMLMFQRWLERMSGG
jgi:asparagine synthase (glutamine-hydrolysing)